MKKHAPWWIAGAFAALIGCGPTTNPNEADFPGAPGSRVPAPTPTPTPEASQSGGGGSRMGPGDGGGLPSTYPGITDLGKTSKDGTKADPAKTSDESESKTSAPKSTPKETPKAAESKKDAPPTPK